MDYLCEDIDINMDSWCNINKVNDISNNIIGKLDIGMLHNMKKYDLLVFLKEKGILTEDENISDATRWLSIESAVERRNSVNYCDYNKKNN